MTQLLHHAELPPTAMITGLVETKVWALTKEKWCECKLKVNPVIWLKRIMQEEILEAYSKFKQ